MLYWFTASDNNAQRHYEKTVEQKFDLRNCVSELKKSQISELEKKGIYGEVNMWGAVPGDNNKRNWNLMNEGDFVIGYQKGLFLHFGKVLFKLHNDNLAKSVWGIDDKGETWEYIYIFDISNKFTLSAESFSTLFKYKSNFHPQGFSHPTDERIRYVNEKFDSVLNGLLYYQNNGSIDDPQETDEIFNESVEKEFKKKIKVNKEDHKAKKTDTNKKQKKGSIKFYISRDSEETAKALFLAEHKCEYDQSHKTFLTNKKLMFTEGHHLIPLKFYQDFASKKISIDHIANIVSLCPNCHSMIHLGNDNDKKKMVQKLYRDRKKRLRDASIIVDISDLYLYYNLL